MQVYAQLAVFLMLVVYGESVKMFPTISDEDQAKIFTCFSYSCNQTICDDFLKCKEKMAKRVYDVDHRCDQQYNPNANDKRCDATHGLYPSDEVARKINQCLIDSPPYELCEAEIQKEREYEICILEVYDRCKLLPKCQ